VVISGVSSRTLHALREECGTLGLDRGRGQAGVGQDRRANPRVDEDFSSEIGIA
jgi:hypothetical protein